MGNPFCYVQLTTADHAKAKAFYGRVFDWKLEDQPMPSGPYTFVSVGEGTGGGIQPKPMPEAPTAWTPYVLVADVNATLAKAREHGAKIVVEKTSLPGMGAFGIFADPSGALLGVWQNDAKK
jgi:predicted enzyme related to lactoylglutathione lyase